MLVVEAGLGATKLSRNWLSLQFLNPLEVTITFGAVVYMFLKEMVYNFDACVDGTIADNTGYMVPK